MLMNWQDGLTHYGLSDEQIRDPRWRKARERLWRKGVSGCFKGEGLARAFTEAAGAIFMGDADSLPIEQSNPVAGGREALWYLHPQQDDDKWRRVMLYPKPRNNWGEDKAYEHSGEQGLLLWRLSDKADIGYRPYDGFGWSPALSERFIRLILSNKYEPEGYLFAGHWVTPLISPSKQYVKWLHGLSSWYEYTDSAAFCYPQLHEDYFFSLLDWVHPLFFTGLESGKLGVVSKDCMIALRYISRPEQGVKEAQKYKDVKPHATPEALQLRQAYTAHLDVRITALGEGHPFYQMWQQARRWSLDKCCHDYDYAMVSAAMEESIQLVKTPLAGGANSFRYEYLPPWTNGANHGN